MNGENENKHWLVRAGTIKLLWAMGLVVLAFLVAADFAVDGHPVFGIDGTFGFYAWSGLFTCLAMILGANFLGLLVKRGDTSYDD